MSVIKIEVLRVAQDARGYVFEPLEAAGLDGRYRNVHVVYTLPGVVRGNHRHLVGTEISSVAGPALVRYRVAGVIHDSLVPAGEVWRFEFPPGVAHAFRNEGSEPTLLAAFNSEAHDPNKPDAVRDVLIE
jgi:dTDP-4-dehydrorhamnose 3,5-epimerase-like enzyme